MDPAEHNVAGIGAGGFFRKLVGVTAKIGKADDFITLVMVAKNDGAGAESTSRGSDALVHALIGENEIVIEGTDLCPLDCGSNSN